MKHKTQRILPTQALLSNRLPSSTNSANSQKATEPFCTKGSILCMLYETGENTLQNLCYADNISTINEILNAWSSMLLVLSKKTSCSAS